MVNKEKNSENWEENRDGLGRFKDGHKGFKKVGSISDNTKSANVLISLLLKEITEDTIKDLIQVVIKNKPEIVLQLLTKIALNKNLDGLFGHIPEKQFILVANNIELDV